MNKLIFGKICYDVFDPKYQPITKVVKKRFKGLVNQDIYLIEEKDGRKNVIGRASDL